MPWFTLRRIDKVTRGFTDENHFDVPDFAQIENLIGKKAMQVGDHFELSKDEFLEIADFYNLSVPRDTDSGEILCCLDDPSQRRPTHTGRELLLMLQGKKPFAAFSDFLPLKHPDIIPEDLFEPYVTSGKFSKRKCIEVRLGPNGQTLQFCRVMYAVPGQEWRFEAFLSLWQLCERHGWSDGLEKMEGYIYGYEPEIDPFFKMET
jgi:hypothetical protein